MKDTKIKFYVERTGFWTEVAAFLSNRRKMFIGLMVK